MIQQLEPHDAGLVGAHRDEVTSCQLVRHALHDGQSSLVQHLGAQARDCHLSDSASALQRKDDFKHSLLRRPHFLDLQD